jgi:hypothetical protein
MRSHPKLGTLLLVGACAGGTYYTTLTASPAAAPADAIACAKAKLDTLGYQVSSFDQTDHRLTVRRVDNSVRRADPTYRRNIDRLEVQAAPGADGKTALTVTAHSFAEFETHRGPTEQEEGASSNAKTSAQAVVDACGRP